MPPKTFNPPKRKGPAFKPPRPVTSAAEGSTSAKRTAPATSRSAPAPKKAASVRPGFQPVAMIISSSEDEQEEEDALSNFDREEPMLDFSDIEEAPQARRTAPQSPTLSPIPPKLLNTLLHHGFEDKKTQIQQGAMDLVETYLQTFVREAIARAKYERGDATKKGDAADNSLQVEDLERLAPQLVLDF
jgi:hypothetical protein